MSKVRVKITGTRPLIMHSDRLANTLDPLSKEMKKLTSKRKKVDADLEQIAKYEFVGALYLGKDEKVIIPSSVLDGVIVTGAKKSRRGSAFKSQVFATSDAELQYDGKPDLSGSKLVEALWEKDTFRFVASVNVGKARIMRTRPRFTGWSLIAEYEYFGEVDEAEVISALKEAGVVGGIGDWRPKYGSFTVERV